MNCKHCQGSCIRKGKSNGIQKYQCTGCRKYQRKTYLKAAYLIHDRELVVLVKEGCGIRSIARILSISCGTVLRRSLKIARSLGRPELIRFGCAYQLDELFSYVGNKDNRICIAYSLEVETGNVIDIVVGRRNKTNLNKLISTLVLSGASKITTDKLNIYKDLIPKEIHSTKFRGINKIERMNLNLRTHLNRLNRKTICYSKSVAVLTAIVKIYFWAE